MDLLTGISTAFAGIGTAYALRTYIKTLKDYLDPTLICIKRRIQDRYYEYNMELDGDILLWKDVLKKDFYNPTKRRLDDPYQPLRLGDMVELNNANLTRWIPLFPGKKYSIEGKIISDKHEKEFPEYHEFGLEEELISRNNSQVLSGSATVQLLPFNKEILLCASGDLCETGMPLILTERLYRDKLQKIMTKEGGANGKIIGTLVELNGEWKDRLDKNFPSNLGNNIYGIPRLAVMVDQIKEVSTSNVVFADAWTQFINLKYGYSSMVNSYFNPTLYDDIENSINMLMNYQQFLESDLIGGHWGLDIEFDETRNWFVPGKFKTFNLNKIDIFGLYYLNPSGRISVNRV